MTATILNQFLREKAGIKTVRNNKYNAKKVDVDGITFDSKREAEYWLKLLADEKKGRIRNLRRQVPYILQEGFRDGAGKWNAAIKYVADFVFEEDGRTVVVDVKSKITEANQVYRLKRKMFKFRYSDCEFREIIR